MKKTTAPKNDLRHCNVRSSAKPPRRERERERERERGFVVSRSFWVRRVNDKEERGKKKRKTWFPEGNRKMFFKKKEKKKEWGPQEMRHYRDRDRDRERERERIGKHQKD